MSSFGICLCLCYFTVTWSKWSKLSTFRLSFTRGVQLIRLRLFKVTLPETDFTRLYYISNRVHYWIMGYLCFYTWLFIDLNFILYFTVHFLYPHFPYGISLPVVLCFTSLFFICHCRMNATYFCPHTNSRPFVRAFFFQILFYFINQRVERGHNSEVRFLLKPQQVNTIATINNEWSTGQLKRARKDKWISKFVEFCKKEQSKNVWKNSMRRGRHPLRA